MTDFMKAATSEGRTWDVVVLDPPKLAPNRCTVVAACAGSVRPASMRVPWQAWCAHSKQILNPLDSCPWRCRGTVDRAGIKYRALNEAALALVKPGGLLMTCSCSGAVTQADRLMGWVKAAALRAGRQITLVREGGAACDHVLHPAYPEGRYLTTLTIRVL